MGQGEALGTGFYSMTTLSQRLDFQLLFCDCKSKIPREK